MVGKVQDPDEGLRSGICYDCRLRIGSQISKADKEIVFLIYNIVMGRKKKDDFIDNNDQAVVTLDDFVIESKIEAFCRTYKPLSAWTEDCDVFNDSKLRTYFKAVVCPYGDPLVLYLQELALRGFSMKNDESGEPVIYCRMRRTGEEGDKFFR
nr:MAG TPA: hypothetical protein [Caudoviricetes sp.]